MINIDKLYEEYITHLSYYNADITSMYLSQLSNSILSKEDELELIKLTKQGNKKAREIFMYKNLQLVVSIAKNFKTTKLNLLDLVQEGNIGLMNAIDKFDINKGYRFSTYATQAITSRIRNLLKRKEYTIKITANKHILVIKYLETLDNLTQILKRLPTDEEIAKKLNISIAKIEELKRVIKIQPISLNQLINNPDIDDIYIETLASSDNNPEDIVANKIDINQIFKILKDCQLTDKQMRILLLYSGYYGKTYTFEEIANLYGVRRQAIQQTYQKILEKIRKNDSWEDFAIYMDYPNQALKKLNMRK